MKRYYAVRGIPHIESTHYILQENSLAESINLTICAKARAALAASNLDNTFWEDTVRDAVFKYNLLYHQVTNSIPYIVWTGSPPHIPKLFSIGELGHIPIFKDNKPKLQPRAHAVRYVLEHDTHHIELFKITTKKY